MFHTALKSVISLGSLALMTACNGGADKAFMECRFELTKVQAIRSDSSQVKLDKLFKRAFIAECMESKGKTLRREQIEMIQD